MTKDRILRLRYKILEGRGRLMEKLPFFALLLMYLRWVAVPGMKKVSTDGRTVYFAPEYLDKLYPHELDYLFCHLIMHIILEDIWRAHDLADDDYHFACDIRLNALLRQMGIGEEKYSHLGTVHTQIPGRPVDVSGFTPLQIYGNLTYSLYILDERARSRFLPDSDSLWAIRQDDLPEGTLILDIPKEDGLMARQAQSASGEDSELEAGGLRQDWALRAAVAAKATAEASGKAAGTAQMLAQRFLPEKKKPALDWRKLLNRFLQEQVCDYSFTPPDRRFADSDFFLPDFNEKEFVTKDILFFVDTSGSVDDSALGDVYSEIYGAVEQFSGKLNGLLGFFDAAVYPPVPFEGAEDLAKIKPRGGGGTSFHAVFDYIRSYARSPLPACIVIFTDGCAPYPSMDAAMNIPVLWLLDNEDITPPWGMVARVKPASQNG